MNMIEWKEIECYEGLYEVSNTGEVRSVPRKIKIRDFYRKIPGTHKRPYIDTHGYVAIDLYKGNKREKKKIHRLVMEAFSPVLGSENLDVNHKDGDKTNNKIENLEWCTRRENLVHAVETGLTSQNIRIIASKGGVEYSSESIYGLYDKLCKVEDIRCKRKTFGGNVCRALNTNGEYYGYTFRKRVI